MVSVRQGRAEAKVDSDTVAVIIVNWNGWKDSLNAYESLCRSRSVDWRLIIVDNASTDGSVEHLKDLGERVELIQNPQNLGFSGGCNVAIQSALATGHRYLFLLNNDAVVEPDTLSSLVGASKRLEDRAVLGSVVRALDTGDLQFFGSRTSARWGIPEWFRDDTHSSLLKEELIPSDFIFGAALFAPAAIFRQIGSLDDRFFLNFEETDWCYRARKQGRDCYVVTRAVVHHKGSASLGSLDGPMQNYFMSRNRLLFCSKHATLPQQLRTYEKVAKHIVWRVRQLVRNPGAPDPSALAMLQAYRDYFRGRFGDCPVSVRALAAKYKAQTQPAPPQTVASS